MASFIVQMTEKLRIGSKNHYVFVTEETLSAARQEAKKKHPDWWIKDAWDWTRQRALKSRRIRRGN